MSYPQIVTYILVVISLLSSCELFGGGRGEEVGSGEVVWKVENQEILTVSTQPLIDDGNVYLIQNSRLKAYILAEGNLLWSTPICDVIRDCDYSRTISHDGDLLFIDKGFSIKAINKTDGSIVWNTTITTDADEVSGIGSPILSQDENYLYAGRKGYVLKLRKEDGEIIKRYPLDRLVPPGVVQGSTEPIISPFGDGRLYIPTSYINREEENTVSKGNVFCYNASTGQVQWEYKLENRYHVYTLSNGQQDSTLIRSTVYDAELTEEFIVVLAGSSVIALNRITGDKVWETFFSGEIEDGFDVGLTVDKGSIYIASAGWHATKLDLRTGEIKWRRDINSSNTSIPTVKNGRLYFNNSGGGAIWVLNTHDGSVIFNERPPNYSKDSYDVYISSLGVGEGYMVNVGSKAVYCLKVP